jgi:hypothetical protein
MGISLAKFVLVRHNVSSKKEILSGFFLFEY